MLAFINFYQSYKEYLFFVASATMVSFVFYFFISTFLEMNMDLVKKTLAGHHVLVSAFFATINSVLYIFCIYYWGLIFTYRGASHGGLLFLLVAWSATIVALNKRFNVRPWYDFLLLNVAWLGTLFLWITKK